MAQAKALDALAPFIALAKTSNSPRQTADVIARATAHQNTFVFTELLQTPRVKQLAADPEYGTHLAALRIFSYGTYADYLASDPPLPALTAEQTHKLRLLSLVSLATDHASLAYDRLRAALALDNDEALESLVVAAVYAGLVAATLDPAARIVRVSSVAPLRDVAPGSLPAMHAALQQWSQRCETTLADLDAQIADIRAAAAARADAAAKQDAKLKRALDAERKAALSGSALGLKDGQTKTVTLNMGGYSGYGSDSGNVLGTGAPAMERQRQPVRMNKRGSNGNVLGTGSDDEVELEVEDGSDNDNGAMDLDDGL